ncbi:MAG TPA: Crp/Fnr family transcriptional regulator, partial [Paraprevotella xylaniphila]|nr:Crp/Fnr family transcriptional regulator [Paraprevotella xylaniphila]
MDAINDYYMEELDLSAMKRFFWEQGERRVLEKQ